MIFPHSLKQHIEQSLDVQVTSIRAVGGGSISSAARLFTSQGHLFVKWNHRPLEEQFEREAEGLKALSLAQDKLLIPDVLLTSQSSPDWPAFIVMDWINQGTPLTTYDLQLGQGLAALHKSTARYFGFPHHNYCGATLQNNTWHKEWCHFYANQRLTPLLTLARDQQGLDAISTQKIERLITHLPEWLSSDEPPALIHGDLWSGNVLVSEDSRPVLIDPAAYFGHREAELGMMSLFGHFSKRVWQSYQEAYPLTPGWKERLPLYELYHLLNHYVLFGGSYGSSAMKIVNRFI